MFQNAIIKEIPKSNWLGGREKRIRKKGSGLFPTATWFRHPWPGLWQLMISGKKTKSGLDYKTSPDW